MSVVALAVAATTYCTADLDVAGWRDVLEITKRVLGRAVQSVLALVTALSGAVKAAAEQVLGSPPQNALMALQLLRKLGERGVLSQHPASSALTAEFERELGSWEAARDVLLSVEMAAAWVRYGGGGGGAGSAKARRQAAEARAAAAACPAATDSALCEVREDCNKLLLQLATASCAVEVVGDAAGTVPSEAVTQWRKRTASLWGLLAPVTRAVTEGDDGSAAADGGSTEAGSTAGGASLTYTSEEAMVAAVMAVDEQLKAADAGVDATEALLRAALARKHPLAGVAYAALLRSGGPGGALRGLSFVAHDASAEQLPEYDQVGALRLQSMSVWRDVWGWGNCGISQCMVTQ